MASTLAPRFVGSASATAGHRIRGRTLRPDPEVGDALRAGLPAERVDDALCPTLPDFGLAKPGPVSDLTSLPAWPGTAPTPTAAGGAEVTIALVAPPRLSGSARVFTAREHACFALGAVGAHAVDTEGYALSFSAVASANSMAGLLLEARLQSAAFVLLHAPGSANTPVIDAYIDAFLLPRRPCGSSTCNVGGEQGVRCHLLPLQQLPYKASPPPRPRPWNASPLRVHKTVHGHTASIVDDPAAAARHHQVALQAAKHAVELMTDSIELSHFHAMLLFVDAVPSHDNSKEHASQGARQVFEVLSLPAEMCCNISIDLELLSHMSLEVDQYQPWPPPDERLMSCDAGPRRLIRCVPSVTMVCGNYMIMSGYLDDIDMVGQPVQNPVYQALLSVSTQLRPLPWPSFSTYAASVQLNASVSVVLHRLAYFFCWPGLPQLTLCHLWLQLSCLSPVGPCSSVVLWVQVQHNCSVGLWAGFLESFQLHNWCYAFQTKQSFFTSLIVPGCALTEMHFCSINATMLLSAPLIEFLVHFELLTTWIARGDFVPPSVTAQSEFLVLHYFSSCCIYGGLVEPVQLLHLLSQWASNSLLFLRWGILKTRLDQFLCCMMLQPWPPPATHHTNTASELVETMSVGSKLNVLDHVTLAASDLIELGCDELQSGQHKNHDVKDPKTWLDCKMSSMYFCASINPVEWKFKKEMSDKLVCCHGRLLFNIKDLQVPWDPGGTSPSAVESCCWHFPRTELGKASGHEGIMLLFQEKRMVVTDGRTERAKQGCVIGLHKIAKGHPRSLQRLEGKPHFKEGGMSGTTYRGPKPISRGAQAQHNMANPGECPKPAQTGYKRKDRGDQGP